MTAAEAIARSIAHAGEPVQFDNATEEHADAHAQAGDVYVVGTTVYYATAGAPGTCWTIYATPNNEPPE